MKNTLFTLFLLFFGGSYAQSLKGKVIDNQLVGGVVGVNA
jgi:hypothetical protein